MKKIGLFILSFIFVFFITGCSMNTGDIPNGKYYTEDMEDYIKIKGTSCELYEGASIEAYGDYKVEDGIATFTYTFRNEIDEASDEYGNVIPYSRVDIGRIEGDSIVIESSEIDGKTVQNEVVYNLK